MVYFRQSACIQYDTLQRNYEQEHERRLQIQRDNKQLRIVVPREKYYHDEVNRSNQPKDGDYLNNQKSKNDLERLRQDFDKLLSNYEPNNNQQDHLYHQQNQAQMHSLIETMRQLQVENFRSRPLFPSETVNDNNSIGTKHRNGYHHASPPIKRDLYEHSSSHILNCSACSNSRLLNERLENAIDTSLAAHRIEAIKQISNFPSTTTHSTDGSTVEHLRKRYHV
jgi:archaellum component FlaC